MWLANRVLSLSLYCADYSYLSQTFSFIFLREMDSLATLCNETPDESLNVFYAFKNFYFLKPKCLCFSCFLRLCYIFSSTVKMANIFQPVLDITKYVLCNDNIFFHH